MRKSDPTRVIGLLSGTSMDGIDAALVEIRRSGERVRVERIDFRTFPFTRADGERLRRAAGRGLKDAEERARLHVRIGDLFARAAIGLARERGGIETVDLIGSHGQTLLHLPARREGATVQIGCGAVIAGRTGVPTVHDFRAADMAAGGEGAPLLPITDYLLFRSRRRTRVILNIGGIANITLLPAGAGWEETTAWDTGPGNALIDRIARALSGGRAKCDRAGRSAARGRVDEALLKKLMTHPFFRKKPPRSTGTSLFGDRLARGLLGRVRRGTIGPDDLLATATAFTARSAGREIRRNSPDDSEVYLCGGGVRNRTLRRMIGEAVAPRPVFPVDELGLSADEREAVGFALLATEFVAGNRYTMKNVTGARSPAPLGTFTPGRRPYTLRLGKDDSL